MNLILTLRVTAEQRKHWQEAADGEGLPLSGWVRKYCDASCPKHGDAQPRKSASERLRELLLELEPTDPQNPPSHANLADALDT